MATDLPGPCRLYVGTEDGLRTARLSEDGLEVRHRAVEGAAVRALAVHPEDPDDVFVGCGLRGWGLHHTTDGGATVEQVGFDDEWVWGAARHPVDHETVYVGTEPPMLYVSTDDGETFAACEGLDDLPSRPEWTFFHEPFYAGHVHGIAVDPDRPERVLAGVEHGALVASPDGGETWTEALVGRDVHRVAVDPTEPDRVFAATGSGLFRSVDGGDGWRRLPGLAGEYLHAVAFAPDRGRMYVYAASEDCPVHASDDGGDTWTPVGEGLPPARPADTLRLHPVDPDVLLYAGDVDDGGSRLFVSPDAGATWRRIDHRLPKVWRLAVVPQPAT